MWTGIVSIFPNLIRNTLKEGVVGRAVANGDLGVTLFDPREYAEDTHKTVDDRPFGGGPGMGPIAVAEHLKDFTPKSAIINYGGKHGISSISASSIDFPTTD